jgi:hypothetical protein
VAERDFKTLTKQTMRQKEHSKPFAVVTDMRFAPIAAVWYLHRVFWLSAKMTKVHRVKFSTRVDVPLPYLHNASPNWAGDSIAESILWYAEEYDETDQAQSNQNQSAVPDVPAMSVREPHW